MFLNFKLNEVERKVYEDHYAIGDIGKKYLN